ncbi:hypothetical protein N0398_06690 [Providencia rettgeri]|nr:hypothetical protein [Providencia rettgeri]
MINIPIKSRSVSDTLSENLEKMLIDFRDKRQLSEETLRIIDEIIRGNKKPISRPAIKLEFFCDICGREIDFYRCQFVSIGEHKRCYFCLKK